MARPFGTPKNEWRIRIDRNLAGRIDAILADSRYNRVAYGIRSALVERLLRNWLDETGIEAQTDMIRKLSDE
jgi:hypothetical protein